MHDVRRTLFRIRRHFEKLSKMNSTRKNHLKLPHHRFETSFRITKSKHSEFHRTTTLKPSSGIRSELRLSVWLFPSHSRSARKEQARRWDDQRDHWSEDVWRESHGDRSPDQDWSTDRTFEEWNKISRGYAEWIPKHKRGCGSNPGVFQGEKEWKRSVVMIISPKKRQSVSKWLRETIRALKRIRLFRTQYQHRACLTTSFTRKNLEGSVEKKVYYEQRAIFMTLESRGDKTRLCYRSKVDIKGWKKKNNFPFGTMSDAGILEGSKHNSVKYPILEKRSKSYHSPKKCLVTHRIDYSHWNWTC